MTCNSPIVPVGCDRERNFNAPALGHDWYQVAMNLTRECCSVFVHISGCSIYVSRIINILINSFNY